MEGATWGVRRNQNGRQMDRRIKQERDSDSAERDRGQPSGAAAFFHMHKDPCFGLVFA